MDAVPIRRRKTRLTPIVAVLGGCALAGCVGSIAVDSDPSGPDDTSGGPVTGPGPRGPGGSGGTTDPGSMTNPAIKDASLKFQCANAALRGTDEPGIRRLTLPEILNTLTDLFGANVMAGLGGILGQLPEDRVVSRIVDVSPEFDASKVPTLFDLMIAVSTEVVSKPENLKTVVGACASTVPLADACVSTFIGAIGGLALRQPLSAAEVNGYLGEFKADGGDTSALKGVIAHLLLSPRFLNQVEFGTPAVKDGARVRLTGWEVASRLSYAITGSMPDAPLRTAAAAGELGDLTKVRAQAARLFDSARGRQRVVELFSGYLGINKADEPHEVFVKQAGIKDAEAFQQEMVKETQDFVRALVYDSNGTFTDLMTARTAFPRSPAMAAIYGTDGVWSGTGTPPTARNQQQGLAMRAAMLVMGKSSASPILRGSFMRRVLLCDAIPPPDPLAVQAREDELGPLDPTKLTTRQISDKKTATAFCAACHARINAIGFALEGFDPLGRPRTVETVYDLNDKPIASLPIDATVPDLKLDPMRPTPSRGAADVAAALGASGEARACLGQQLFRFTRLRPEADSDSCLLAELESAAKAGAPLKTILIQSVASEDIFWTR